MSTASDPGLADPDLEPLFWEHLRLEAPSAWHGHVPFAHWLTAALQPLLVVELGTHAGVSYAAFCQAVAKAGLGGRCVAVDTWQGDAHAGVYAEDVFADLDAFNAAHFAAFSTLRRATFDAAVADFADGSIDLLHIDGFHTYEAVRHDFETWQAKLSSRAVVLFHDIAVRERGFGVWRFWEEVTRGYPHFAFDHAHGLGVLAVGSDVPTAMRLLSAAGDDAAARIRARFAAAGTQLVRLHDRLAAKAILEEPSAEPPPIDAQLVLDDIYIVERFIGPAELCALTLPRDAVTRGAQGCAVWVASLDGQDWRHGNVVVTDEGDDADRAVQLVFQPFRNTGMRHFHLFVTNPCQPGAALPTALADHLANRRPPIALGTPQLIVSIPNMPLHGLYLTANGGVVTGDAAA